MCALYKTGKWEVGGDGIRFTVSRECRMDENVSAREWRTKHDRVIVFDSEEKAQKLADRLNNQKF